MAQNKKQETEDGPAIPNESLRNTRICATKYQRRSLKQAHRCWKKLFSSLPFFLLSIAIGHEDATLLREARSGRPVVLIVGV